MKKVGSLLIDVAANVAGIKKDFDQIRGQTQSFVKTTKKILAGLGIGYLTKQLVDMGKETVVTMRTLADTAHSVGTSSDKFSALAYAVEQTGTEVVALKTGYRNLARSMGDTSRGLKETAFVFDSLGVKIKDTDGSFRDTSNVILDVAEKFGQMNDATMRSYYAIKLFGRSGSDLIPFLAEGKEGIKKWIKEAKEFGQVVREDVAADIEVLMRSFGQLKSIGTGALRELAGGFSQQLGQATNSWVKFMSSTKSFERFGQMLGELSKVLSMLGMNVVFVAKFYSTAVIGLFKTIPTAVNKILKWLEQLDFVNQAKGYVNGFLDWLSNTNIAQAIKESLGVPLEKSLKIPKLELPTFDDYDLSDLGEEINSLVKKYEEARAALNKPLKLKGAQKGGDFGLTDEQGQRKTEALREKINKLIESLKSEKFILQQTTEAQYNYNLLKKAGLAIDEKTGEIKQKEFQAQGKQIMALGEQVRVLENVQNALSGLETSTEKNTKLKQDLNTAYKAGQISLENYQKIMGKINAEIAEQNALMSQSSLNLAGAKIETDIAEGMMSQVEIAKRRLKQLQSEYALKQSLLSQMRRTTDEEIMVWNDTAAAMEAIKQRIADQKRILSETTSVIAGMRMSLREYIDDISNVGKQAGEAVVASFKKLEDGLVEFIKTGKFQFKDFADFVIEQLLRIAVKQNIINPLAKLAFTGLGSLGGGGAGAAAESPLVVAHGGGVVGRNRLIPASTYAHAPRYHQGLRANERPAILEVGEQVIPKNQVGRERGMTINVGPINVTDRNPALVSDLRDGIEQKIIDVLRKHS